MKQKNLMLSKITLPAFAIFFIAALIMYITEGGGDDFWISFEQAKTKAQEQNSRAIVYFYSPWNSQSKLIDNAIFSKDSTLQKLQENYLLARVNVTDQDNSELRERYLIESVPYLLILNSKGRESQRIRNLQNPRLFQRMIDDPEPSYVDSWAVFDDAKAKASDNEVNMAVFIADTDYGINGINLFIKDDEIRDFINANFVPTVLLYSEMSDRKHIEEVKGELSVSQSKIFGNANVKVGSLYIISPDGETQAEIELKSGMAKAEEFIHTVESKLGKVKLIIENEEKDKL